ncbi:amidase [Nonomuraea typhae]|uniref:amidase n=1 Tax=Nonomuraea typhae TaxID=2603600 RepID=UPI0012F716A2|nr:amidase [Nonomuraea typhae]
MRSQRAAALSASVLLTVALAGATPAHQQRLDLETPTIPELQREMNAGRLTSVELTGAYLDRIERLDGKLHAVITVNPDALAQARQSDQRRRERRLLGPMDGIPMLLKDNVGTGDRQPTTAGSLALRAAKPRDAFIVGRLRAGGAVLLGKANLSEWANFRSTQSASGWSAVGGQTANPYVLDRNPCGSSSGSGTAVAAQLAAVAIGTETDGSIVCPSGANALVGLKPTIGRVSRTGIVPISAAQDTAGPMTRNVTDTAVLLAAIQGADPADPPTQQAQNPADYTRFLDRGALRGARVGVWREGNVGVSNETDAVFDRAVAKLRELGATVVDPADLPGIGGVSGPEFTALLCEFKRDINAYLAATPGEHPRTLAGLIAFNRANAGREMPFFGQELFETAEATSDDAACAQARTTATTLARKAIDDTLRAHRLDAIIAPTGSPAWPTDVINGDHFVLGTSTPAAVSGYPSITVPAGFAFELPIGVSFIGARWSEPRLIGLAYAYEQATRVRKPPRFLPVAPLHSGVTTTTAQQGTAGGEPNGAAR